MSTTTLRQGNRTAILSELAYHHPKGFQDAGTWYATEEVITADSNAKLKCGPAALIHGGKDYSITVTVLESEEVPREGGELGEDETHYSIEIDYAEGLPKLAYALGLLDGYNQNQLAALGIV